MTRGSKTAVLFSLIALSFSFQSSIYCQSNNTSEVKLTLSIPVVSLINFALDGGNQIITYSYSVLEPNNVEQIITPNTGNNTWLNYTSVVKPGSTNFITVNISSGNLPADVVLHVKISDDAGYGSGSTGMPVSEIVLSRYPQNIIVNIGSCYTGTGIKKGHRLTYIWENKESYNYNKNYANGDPIGVTYTISSTQ